MTQEAQTEWISLVQEVHVHEEESRRTPSSTDSSGHCVFANATGLNENVRLSAREEKIRMSICDQKVESQQDNGGTSRQCDDESDLMNKDEQRTFLEALSSAMKSLKENFDEVTMTMARKKQWQLLEAIQDRMDVLASCLSEEHAGVPGCWKKSTASKTIADACSDFDAAPLLSKCLVHLSAWNERPSPDFVGEQRRRWKGKLVGMQYF